MKPETWLPVSVAPYGQNYHVSNTGLVKRISVQASRGRWTKERLLSHTSLNTKGYPHVQLHHEDKPWTVKIHRLVALAFLPNPENKPQVNHINGIKTDNRVENLEWATASENMQHAVDTGLRLPLRGENHPNAKLDAATVLAIRSQPTQPTVNIASTFNLDPSTVASILSRETWDHVLSTPQDNPEIVPREGRRSGTDHPNAILTEALVMQAFELRPIKSSREIAETLGVPKTAIDSLFHGKTWMHLRPKELPKAGGRVLKVSPEDVAEVWAMKSLKVKQPQIAETLGLTLGDVESVLYSKSYAHLKP